MRRFTALMVIMTLLLAINSSRGATITIDFEPLTHNQDATSYLAGFGVSVTPEIGTYVAGFDETITYGGGVVGAPSGMMYLSMEGTPAARQPPNMFTLDFGTPLDSFGFSDSAILVPSINSPWTATAFDGPNGTGSILDSAAYFPPAVHPTVSFVLNGPGIQSVTFNQTASIFAAFYAGNFDDFILTSPDTQPIPEPASIAIWSLLGLAGMGVAKRRRRAASR